MFGKWMVAKKYLVPGNRPNLSTAGLFSILANRCLLLSFLAVSLLLSSGATLVFAQDQSQAPPPQGNTQDSGKPKQDVPPEAGGPTDNVGPYAIPKKNPEEAPAPPPPAAPAKVEGMPDYSIKVNVPLVNVDVMVSLKNNGQFVSGLTKENFRLYEDGAPQQISNFGVTKAPITAVLLVEFGATRYSFMLDALRASYAFAHTLTKDDWIAVSYYDMNPHILVDFTQDKQAVYGALNQMRIPGFSETDLFDTLYDTLDQVMKKIKDTKDVTIFPISVGQIARIMNQAGNRGMGIHASEMDYLQADNEMRTFAAMTGGRAYFPRFQAEYGEDFQDIGSDIRNQYSLAYHPTNSKLDGTYRKLKVQVVAPDGGPLKAKDQKGKEQKIEVVSRDGYTAKHTVD